MIEGESVRFTFLLMEIDGEPRKILSGETVSLNPMNRVRIAEIGSTAPFGHGTRLQARGIEVDELRSREMPLVDLLPGGEAFEHYTFSVSVRHRDRTVGNVTWVVKPEVQDWLDRADRIINDEIRLAFMERAAKLTSGDPRIRRRLLDEYKKASQWRRARELLKKMAADTPDTSLYAELLEVHQGLGDRQGMLSVLNLLVEREPETPKWRLALAELLEETGRRREAAPHYEAALKTAGEGERPALYKHLGYLYTELEEYRKAVSMYTEAARLDQKDANLHYNLAFLHDRLGQPAKAEFHLENAVTLESQDLEGRLALAARLVERGEIKKAEPFVREVLKIDPDNLDALLLMTGIAEAEGRKQQLRDLYRRIHRLDPDNDAVIYNLGVLLYELGEYRESADWLSRYAKARPDDVSVYQMLFDSHVKTGKSDEAFQAARRISELKPEELYPYHYIVDYLTGKGQYTRVAEILEPAVEANPDAEVLKKYLLGAYTRIGKTGPALSIAEELLENNPGDRELLEFLLDGYRARGETESAFRTAETLALLDQADDSTYDFLFDHLSRQEDFARIITIMDRAVSNTPDRVRLREYLVVAYLKTGDEEKAAAHMEAIVRLRPEDTVMLMNLARLQEKRGKYAEALDAYEKVVTLDPANEEAAEGYLRTRLKRVGVE
jgi:tetratricopeptide (TPR) repeat protein